MWVIYQADVCIIWTHRHTHTCAHRFIHIILLLKTLQQLPISLWVKSKILMISAISCSKQHLRLPSVCSSFIDSVPTLLQVFSQLLLPHWSLSWLLVQNNSAPSSPSLPCFTFFDYSMIHLIKYFIAGSLILPRLLAPCGQISGFIDVFYRTRKVSGRTWVFRKHLLNKWMN